MLSLTDNLIKNLKRVQYAVYSLEPLREGVECFPLPPKNIGSNDKIPYCLTSVSVNNIKHDSGRFYYTSEDLSSYADWYPAHALNVGSKFTRSKLPKTKCTSKVSDKLGRVIGSDRFLVDVSGMPAFEDSHVTDYYFYSTLFNDYSIKQIRHEREKLYDLKITCSKYDLTNRLQNSDILRQKDFTIINTERMRSEDVKVGIVTELDNKNINMEYGTVFINMNNLFFILWN